VDPSTTIIRTRPQRSPGSSQQRNLIPNLALGVDYIYGE